MNDSIRKHCIYNAKLFGDEFVGFKYENDNLIIQFPLGYSQAEDDETCRKDIQNLMTILDKYLEKSDSNLSFDILNHNNRGFPFSSYIYLIKDYFINGYYKEKERTFKLGYYGRINWNKTIKTISPIIVKSKLIFPEYIINSNNTNQNLMITKIHEYLIYESFKKIGFIFTDYLPIKPSIRFDCERFVSIIKEKMYQTCNESELLRFKSMLDVLNYLNTSNSKNIVYGTENFEYIWQDIIDYTFGIDNKDSYYPHTFWTIENKEVKEDLSVKRAALQPDTIMIKKVGRTNNYFVLDSKYYKFGLTQKANHLPNTDSIIKQIAYAEYIEEKKQIEEKKIYNAFIMPFDCIREKGKKIQIKGYAISEQNTCKQYSKIFGVFLDVKTIMYNFIPKNKELITDLAEVIINYNEKINNREGNNKNDLL